MLEFAALMEMEITHALLISGAEALHNMAFR